MSDLSATGIPGPGPGRRTRPAGVATPGKVVGRDARSRRKGRKVVSEPLPGLVVLGVWVDPLAADLAAAALNANGIVATVQSDPFNTSYGGGRMHRPGSDPILEVLVRAEDEAEARRVLAATDDYLPPEFGDRAILDWSEGIDARRARRDADVQRIADIVALVLLIIVVVVLVGAAIASAA